MPTIQEYNRKIGSMKNTSKITKTMKMVSASKLRKAQDAQRNASAYADELNKLIYRIGGSIESSKHALLESRSEVKNVLLILFSSDKGLCGGFNNNLFKFADEEIKRREALGQSVTLSCCGRRGYTYYQKRATIKTHYEGITQNPDPLDSHKVAQDACESFLSGEFDEVFLVYNHFVSPISQTTRIHHMLPLKGADFEFEGSHVVDHDFISEPPVEVLLENLIPQMLDFLLFFALLENSAGEHGARMTAMENATKNATEMVEEYTLLRNRARQAAITTELIEIISGAEAL
jgi:F-type H+-transporting ATPase subunit gamma